MGRKGPESLDALFAVFGDGAAAAAAAAAAGATAAAAATAAAEASPASSAAPGEAAAAAKHEPSADAASGTKSSSSSSSSKKQQQKKRRAAPGASPEESQKPVKRRAAAAAADAAAALTPAAAADATAAAADAAADDSKAFDEAPASDGLVTRVLLSDKNCLHEVVCPKQQPTKFRDFPLQTTIESAAAADAVAAAVKTETPETPAAAASGPSTADGEDSSGPTSSDSPEPAAAAPSPAAAATAADTAGGGVTAARQWKFELDSFQQRSILCLEAGENVLVAAHTSAGKTVVAEYAIAMALRDRQRVVYTSPIKALSNQKYRDLCEVFGSENVGLLTGDVSVQPEASVVVMTTEILRSMLYRGSVLVREVRWVVYDEIHYMRDRERGVVWEESIILLPAGCRLVFLSATIPNAREFACWIAALRKQPCHVLYTEKRPTPLQHYMYPQGGDGVFLVMDEHKVFREDNFLRAVAALQQAAEQQQQQQQQRRKRSKNRSSISKIVMMCEMRKYTPVIVFCFSKRECEANAQALIGRADGSSSSSSSSSTSEGITLTNEDERKLIAEIFQNAVNTLDEEDRQLPQIKSILPLLLRGIGIHHGGLLPFVRELIEILFQESLIRVLFSTETFSMGVNMPAKTVVFTAIRKWDGLTYRLVSGGEYIQMAGRAGRRGLDDRGIAIIMFDEQVDPEEAKVLFTGGAAPLISTFHLGFNMLLNLYRIEDANPAFMISRSFAHFQQHRRSLGLQQEQQELQRKLQAASDIRTLVKLPKGETEPEFDVEEAISSFYGRKHELLQQGRLLRSIAMQPQHLVRFLQPGRLVFLIEDDQTEWGWATCVRKLQKRNVPSTNSHEGPIEQLLVHCLVSCCPASVGSLEDTAAAAAAARPRKPQPKPPVGEEGKDYVLEVVPFSVSCVARVSKCKMSLPAGGDVDSPDARRSINFQLQIIQDKFKDCGGLPLLDPVVDMKVDHPQLADLVSRMAASEKALKENPFSGHPLCSYYYAAHHQRMQMQSRLRAIREELDAQKDATVTDALRAMRRVLHRLGFLEGADVVTLKGRVACEVSTADELLASELLFSNALADMRPEELCAVLSCLVCHEKHDEPEPTDARLLAGVQKVREVARSIARVFVECGYVWGSGPSSEEQQQQLLQQQQQLQQQEEREVEAVESYVNNFKHALVSLTYGWVSGQSFASLIRNTSLYEGTVIRCLRRLEELLRQLACASRAIGNEELEAKCVAAIRQLRRGIIFSSSLYL